MDVLMTVRKIASICTMVSAAWGWGGQGAGCVRGSGQRWGGSIPVHSPSSSTCTPLFL